MLPCARTQHCTPGASRSSHGADLLVPRHAGPSCRTALALSACSLKDWKQLELFEREAKVLESLDHPGIPRYLASFEQDTEQDRAFFLVQVGRRREVCRGGVRGGLEGKRGGGGGVAAAVREEGIPQRPAGALWRGCVPAMAPPFMAHRCLAAAMRREARPPAACHSGVRQGGVASSPTLHP